MRHCIHKQELLTFRFRKLVITLTASAESGTGEPKPISSPVSLGRGSNAEDFEDPPSALVSTGREVDSDCTSAGASGAERTSLGVVSIPFRPRFSPCLIIL